MALLKVKERHRICWWLAAFLCLLTATGCSGLAPFQPDKHQEEGPANGLFSGPAGEFQVTLPQPK